MFLSDDYQVVEKYFAGLLEELKSKTLEEKESPLNSFGTETIKKYGLGKLLIAKERGGLGATLDEAISIHHAIGGLAPSMAIQLTMHNFTISIMEKIIDIWPYCGPFLQTVAEDNLLVASGFAEGKPGASILDSSLIATKTEDGYLVKGVKQPCTMANHMDYLTAGIAIEEGGEKYTGFAVIDPKEGAIEVSPFWKTQILAATDSHKLTIHNARIADAAVLIPNPSDANHVGAVAVAEITGIGHFQLLMSASYLGMAAGLVSQVIEQERGDISERADLIIQSKSAIQALKGVISLLESGSLTESGLAQLLVARYNAQSTIQSVSNKSLELLGGLSFIGSFDSSYLMNASRGICFHPINKKQAEPLLVSVSQ